MRRPVLQLLALALLSTVGTADDRIRPAVERAIPLLERASAGSADQRECFTCHNQGLPVLALQAARSRGFRIDQANFERQVDHTYAHLNRNRERYASGEGTGGKVDTAGYALWTLDAANRAPDETTTAVAEFLLTWNSDDVHWTCSSDRPPSEASNFTTTYLALRGLSVFGADAQRDRIAARTLAAKEWLASTSPDDNEDRVFRLLALPLVGAPAADVAAAADDLLQRQRDDGGWSQLDDHDSDAYATATALVVLYLTDSLSAGDTAYQRGVNNLLDTQLEDGSWHIVSRSKPFQAYYESGFPHGTDQFISISATAWAIMAFLNTVPVLERTAPPPPPQSDRNSPAAAYAAIEALGGEITYDERSPLRPAVSVSFYENERITDADLQLLAKLTSLQQVILDGTDVTDEGLELLAPLRNLRSLGLGNTRVTGRGLAVVKAFPHLEILELHNLVIEDDELTYLLDLPELRMLFLSSTNVSSDGLQTIGQLTSLDTLDLSNTHVTSSGFEHLTAMQHLRDLRINDTDFEDAGLEPLSRMKNLQTLVLNETDITDAAVPHLKAIRTLRRLWIPRTKLTRNAVAELRRAFPHCEIVHTLD